MSELVLSLSPLILGTIFVFLMTIIGLFVIARFTPASEESFKRFKFFLQLILAISGLVAGSLSLYFTYITGVSKRYGLINLILPAALAQNGAAPPAAPPPTIIPPPYLGTLLTMILVVLLLILCFGVLGSLFIPDIPANASRRAAANDIVKTFGGFFIGVLTSFLKQATGG
jgi:hypothetical protein